MAGMLPGVELAGRRRSRHHLRQEDMKSRRDLPSLREHPPMIEDATASRARMRLEQKLNHFFSTSKPKRAYEGRSSGTLAWEKGSGLGSKILGKPWIFQFNNRSKSEKEICCICLEEFQAEQGTVDLPCSHKYHSNCLLQWLTHHPHCPYCRTPVPSWWYQYGYLFYHYYAFLCVCGGVLKGISTPNLIIAVIKELLRVGLLFKARKDARKWRQVTGNQTLSMFI